MNGASTIRKSLYAFWLCTVSVCIGLNWTALQLVAWTGMTITNARTMDLSLALETAMSGDQHCLVCRLANRQRESDSESPWNFSQSAFEFEGVVANYKMVLNLCSFSLVMPVRDDVFLHQCVPPPDPPPEKFFNYTS